jgi:hypothetical protein
VPFILRSPTTKQGRYTVYSLVCDYAHGAMYGEASPTFSLKYETALLQ